VEYLERYVVGSSRSSTPETEMRDASSPRRMGSMMMVHNNASEIRTDGLWSLGFGITHMLQKRCRTKVAWKGECGILYTSLIRSHLTDHHSNSAPRSQNRQVETDSWDHGKGIYQQQAMSRSLRLSVQPQ
jgi:hypothetical protein